MRRGLLALLLSVAALWTGLQPAIVRAEPEPVYTADEFLLLPLRMHLLRSKELPAADTRLTPGDCRRILGKVNGIWQQAGIRFWEESLLDEPAGAAELIQTLAGRRVDGHLRLLRPRASLDPSVVHVYYLREMQPNGIALGPLGESHQFLFVKDSARLRPVQGGIDEPLPRVTAHEIGHALSLPHRQDTFNLMASGTTGTLLNRAEAEQARARAQRFDFHLTPRSALEEAKKRAEPKRTALLEALASLPGGEVARAAREALGSVE